jgi:signal transduction histidine kinase
MHGDLLTIRIEDVTDGARRARAEQDFVVNAAHEFLSPLTSIAGATHVLREGAKDDPEACDRFLRHISEATERLIGISRSLLVLARAEAGVEPPRFEVVGVKSAIFDALDTAGLSSEDISIRCNPSVTVFVDSDLFRIALATVLENARRHSRDGRVELEVDRTEAGRVTVDVVNRSYHMPSERLEMLKNRFKTGAGRDSGGFGIGLSIAERAVRLLDGELTLTSEAEYTKICVHLRSGSFT